MTTPITLIFYDISKENICHTFSKCSYVTFDDQKSCINYIESRSKSETLFLITSLSNAGQILPTINGLRQLDSVFIYSNEEDEQLQEKYSKIIGIFSQYTNLFQCIEENIDLVLKQIEAFQFYEQHQKSTRELTKESGSFLWLKLFKDVVLKLPHNEQAKQEMVDKLKEYYRNNNYQLKLIEKFNREYKSEDAIEWYTGQPFLYKQLNRALRTEDIELLYKFRYFISDLSKDLFTQYKILKDSFDSKIVFYRGVKLSIKEANILEQNVEQLISTNGYLSTSLSKEVALRFADESIDTEIGVLFEIECDFGQINSVIMASIAYCSKHPEEEEILFDLGATFKIVSVTKNTSLKVLEIKMEATDQGTELAQEYIHYYGRKLNIVSVAILFGYLLAQVGQYDKSEQYFQRLLNNPNGEDIASIYYHMGVAKHYQGDYKTALKYYQQSYDMLIDVQPSCELTSSYILNNIGSILQSNGQYNEALNYYKRALKIRKTHSDYLGTANSLRNIAIIYQKVGKHEDALDYMKQSLQISGIYLPSEHTEVAKVLSDIASLCNDMDELDTSLILYQKSLDIRAKCLPDGHENIATSLNLIGTILTKQQKYDEALNYYIRALRIYENIFPNGHLSVTSTLTHIGHIYYKKENYTLALEYLTKSLAMREKLFSGINDSIIVNLFTNFGLVYTELHKYDDALTYYMFAFEGSEIVFPTGHFTITDCLTNIGILYREMENYAVAVQYFKKALKNEEESLTKPNSMSLARTYDHMGICLCHQGDAQTGLEYRMKAVQIFGTLYPRIQYARTADAVGDVYSAVEMHDVALECYTISLNIKLERLAIDDVSIADTLMKIGDIYVEKEKNEYWKSNEQYKIKGRFYYEKALGIYESNEHINTVHILNRIGYIYENTHKYHLALEYYRAGLSTSETYFTSNNSIKKISEDNVARIKWLIK